MSFLFKNYSLVKVIYLLIRCYKTRFFLWNTNNIDRNGANKQNIQTHTKHSEKDNTEKWYPPFFETTPYFTNPSLFMGKYEPSAYFFFFENFENSNPNYDICSSCYLSVFLNHRFTHHLHMGCFKWFGTIYTILKTWKTPMEECNF